MSALSDSSNRVESLRRNIVRILLVIPFIGLLWIPFYNHQLPTLWGFPFFYWYQFAWVPITSLLIWIVYRRGVRRGVE